MELAARQKEFERRLAMEREDEAKDRELEGARVKAEEVRLTKEQELAETRLRTELAARNKDRNFTKAELEIRPKLRWKRKRKTAKSRKVDSRPKRS
jgi:hypothetical protein